MPSDSVTEKEIAKDLVHYGEYTIEQRVEKRIENTHLVMFKVDYNKYGYQRFDNDVLKVEKVLASDRPVTLGIFPIPPLNVPAKYGSYMMLKLTTPLVLDPKSHVDAYLTMPIEIGVTHASGSDVKIIDAFSIGLPKYALYGTPDLGYICRYYETRINSEIPKAAPYKEAVIRAHFHNYTDEINTINRSVSS